MTFLNDFTRYAIYYVPPESDYLTRFVASWFGWDVYKSINVEYPVLSNLNYDIKEITSTPSKYGLHATLKAPFCLAPDRTIDELRLSLLVLSHSIKQFEIPSICLRIISGFIAIVPTIQNESVNNLAKKCVEELDCFRQAKPLNNLNARRAAGLSDSEERNLLKWGYPYVLDDFRFHLTLTNKLSSKALKNVFPVLSSELQPVLNGPLVIGKICLLGESNINEKFEVIEEFSFGD